MLKQVLTVSMVVFFAICLAAGDNSPESEIIGKTINSAAADEGFTKTNQISVIPNDNPNPIVYTYPGYISGTVIDENTDPIQNVFVFVTGSPNYDSTNGSGEYLIENISPGTHSVYFKKSGFHDTSLVNIAVTSGDTAEANIQMTDNEDAELTVWYGNLNGTPVEVNKNSRVTINAYVQCDDWVYAASVHFSLGTNDTYICSLLSQAEGTILYPFTEWDVKEFLDPDGSPPNPAGWHAQSFLGFARYVTQTAPWLHLTVPTKVLEYKVKTVNNNDVIGHLGNALGRGFNPYSGTSNASDTTGDIVFRVIEHFSPFLFDGDDIVGTVTNQLDDPLEGVLVEVLGTERTDVTDADGDYAVIQLAPAYYNVHYSHPLCRDTTVVNVRVRDGYTTYQDVVMTEYATLGGVVTNPEAAFIESVLVTIQGTGLSAYTDINGEYLIGQVTPGIYSVSFSHPYYFDKTVPGVHIDAGDTTELNVVMDYLGAISGTVRDKQSVPIESVFVEIDGTGIDAYSDDGGEFFLDLVDPGTYSATFSHPDYAEKRVFNINVISGDTTDLVVSMELLGIVTGVVTKSDGLTLLDDVMVKLLYDDDPVDSLLTDPDGDYLFTHLGEGLYDIEASKVGYVTTLVEDIQIIYDSVITRNIILIEDIGLISGIVSDGSSPLESVYVSVIAYGINDFSDPSGIYQVDNLPSGFYDLKFSKIGFEDKYETGVEVLPEQTTNLDVIMVDKPGDLSVVLYTDPFYRAGMDGFYYCEYQNRGSSTAENVALQIILPDEVNYLSSDPPGTLSGDTLTWLIGNLNSGQVGNVEVGFNVLIGTPVGSLLSAYAMITADVTALDLIAAYAEITSEVVAAWNSQDKFASPPGFGIRKFIAEDDRLVYAVFFENEAGASGDVVDIIVSDTLDFDLDWSTFHAGPTSHPGVCNINVDLIGGILNWTFSSINLPPNVTPPAGEGFVLYSADPYPTVPNETEITNRAGVKFDDDAWVMCPSPGPLLRTIDNRTPISQVSALPAQVMDDHFTVEWTKSDFGGSGITFVEIYVSVNSGPFSLWYTAGSTENEHDYYGEYDSCYAFYSIAIDSVGHVEQAPGSPDAEACLLLGYLYLPGDANMWKGIWPAATIGSDVTYLINYLRGVPVKLCLLDGFTPSADANGDCIVLGSDVTFLINYFRTGLDAPKWCPDYRPAWPTYHDVPEDKPEGWPNCENPILSDGVTVPQSKTIE